MSVYTLATLFIVSCPASSPPLPFKAFPYLQVDGNTCTCEEPYCNYPGEYIKEKRWGDHGKGWPKTWQKNQGRCSPPTAGQTATFTAAKDVPAGSYVTFVSGLSVTSVKGSNINGALLPLYDCRCVLTVIRHVYRRHHPQHRHGPDIRLRHQERC